MILIAILWHKFLPFSSKSFLIPAPTTQRYLGANQTGIMMTMMMMMMIIAMT
jgi:hypothetical protein